jgi:hypothetical protein
MLRSLKALQHTAIDANDGVIGTISRFLVDADHWTVRYLVVETGGWWSDREVLISPMSVREDGGVDGRISLALSRAQIRTSPVYEPSQPVTRAFEAAVLGHYGHPPYWTGPFLWGPLPAATAPTGFADTHPTLRRTDTAVLDATPGDLGLVDSQDVLGTHLQATDGDIGHVEDFLAEDQTWTLRYLVVDTSNWWIGKPVLISPDWIDRFEWPAGKLHIGLDRASVKDAPEYDGVTPPARDTEATLYRHHHRPPYWTV